MSVLKSKTVNSGNFAFPSHLLYKKYENQWSKIRHVIEGQEAIKEAGERYLKRLHMQKLRDYMSYLDRAVFVNTTARILNTNTGIIVRKEPKIKYSSEMAEYFERDDMSFLSFKELFRHLVREVMQVSRVITVIDIDDNRPVPVNYNTENVINWRKDDKGNLQSVLICYQKEIVEPVSYDVDYELVYVDLYLNKKGEFSIRYYDDNKNQVEDKTPSLNGRTINYIPITPITPFGVSIDPIKPVLIDVANINLSHYKTSADLETGRHFVGLPQPVITGANKDTEIYIGSEKALVIPNEKAKATYLEFMGQGLNGLSSALKEKEGQMSQFSAQLADTSSKGSEAEGTVRLRYSSDAANLADIAGSVETGINNIYAQIADWAGEEKPTIELNKDFISTKLSYNEIKELTNSWLEGSLSDEELAYNLVRGEISTPEMSKKEKKKNKTKGVVSNDADDKSTTNEED